MGYHGCPNVSSIRRFISPEKLWPWDNNAEWQEHAVYHWQHPTRDRDRIKLMANQVRELFGAIPDDLETFALASQITQAEAKKFFIEMTRLRKWRTSGILWWNVIDGWPQFSDAIVDYYFGVKLAYHYIRRVQQPVSVIVGEPGPGKRLPVIVSNDSRNDADVRYRIWDADSGETVAGGTFRSRANENWQVGTLRTYASDQRLYLIEWEIGRPEVRQPLSGRHAAVRSGTLSAGLAAGDCRRCRRRSTPHWSRCDDWSTNSRRSAKHTKREDVRCSVAASCTSCFAPFVIFALSRSKPPPTTSRRHP